MLTSVWHGHLGDIQTVENVALVVCDIVEDETLPVIESNPEAPFLPVNGVAIHREGSTLRLLNNIWLEVCPEWLV